MRLSQWFVVVVALFVTSLITANVVAVKPVALGRLILPAGVLIFPVSYILDDVLTEVYGIRRARLVIWLGFACNLLFVATAWLGGLLPPPASGTGRRPTSVSSASPRACWPPPSPPTWWGSSPTRSCWPA